TASGTCSTPSFSSTGSGLRTGCAPAATRCCSSAVLAHNLAVAAAVQHLLGLVTAVLIYATGVHFGARRWLAALATVPILFDPLQLDIEQYVLTDVSATFLLVAALVVLVWKRDAIGKGALVGSGLLIA